MSDERKKKRKPKINVYLDEELYNRVYNAIWFQRQNISHEVSVLLLEWVAQQETQEFHYTEDGQHKVKPAGEPFPLRPEPKLRAGRPQGT